MRLSARGAKSVEMNGRSMGKNLCQGKEGGYKLVKSFVFLSATVSPYNGRKEITTKKFSKANEKRRGRIAVDNQT